MRPCTCGHVIEAHKTTGCKYDYNCGCTKFTPTPITQEAQQEELELWRMLGRNLKECLGKRGRDAIRALDPKLDVEMTRVSLLLDGKLERAKKLIRL